MMKCGRVLSALSAVSAAVLIQAGCAARVQTDFDRDADFSRYHTYDWIEPPQRASADAQLDPQDPFASNSLLDKRVRAAVERELEARGFRRATANLPDVHLNYHVIFREKLVASGSDFGTYNRYRYGGFGTSFDFSVRQYQEGTIILDIVDRSTDQLVWRGWSAGRNSDGNFDEREIKYAVREILKRFPPRRKKVEH